MYYCQILFNFACPFAVHHEKSFVPTLFKVSVEHLLILKTLSLEKEIIVLEKISKIVSPKICTNPVERTCN